MPCYDYRDDATEISKNLAIATRVACELARVAREFPDIWARMYPKLSSETVAWVTKHDKEDRDRIRQESEEQLKKVIRKNALDKLTEQEKQILGVK